MSFLDHTRRPAGLGGKLMVRVMNLGHRSLTRWGLSQLPDARYREILDCGCGRGAAIRRLLRASPQSTVQGVDYSAVSVQTARRAVRAGSRLFPACMSMRPRNCTPCWNGPAFKPYRFLKTNRAGFASLPERKGSYNKGLFLWRAGRACDSAAARHMLQLEGKFRAGDGSSDAGLPRALRELRRLR